MKKVLLFFATVAMVASVASCKKDNRTTPGGNNDPSEEPAPEKKTAKTAAENLTLHLGFDKADAVVETGKGLGTFTVKGDGEIIEKGFIGGAYNNKAADQTKEAYGVFELAADNLFKEMDDVTFTAWVKLPEAASKGAIFSLNGSGIDWPAFIAYFDNSRVDEETNVKLQQVNGRLVFHDEAGAEQNLWLDTFDAAFARYDKWFQFGFTYDHSTGAWALYVDGAEVKTAEFAPKIAFKNLVTDKCNKFYVGAWASFVEGASSEAWQSFFAGSIDEIRMYNKALTKDEINALYKEELAFSME